MKKIIFVCLLIFTSGCSTKTTKIEDDSKPISVSEKSPDIYFIADNQFHIVDGRAYPVENYLSDKVSGVAVRPPQTTVFGPYAYEAFLEGLDQSSLLIHLGDVADVSCPQELDRFFIAMKKYVGPWVFVPGNHDGFYTGNSQYKSNNTGEWDHACLGKRLDKSDAIISYLSNRFGKSLVRKKDGVETVEGNWSVNGNSGRYFASINHNPDAAQQGFIIQQVSFKSNNGSNISIVILDTSQYEKPPKYRSFFNIIPGYKIAGITGEILKSQMILAEKWITNSQDEGGQLFIAGHHPLKEGQWSIEGLAWFGGSKWLKGVMETNKVKGYISAHTHKGGTRKLWGDKYEWNITSLVDWPLGLMEMRIKDSQPSIKEILFYTKTPQGISGTCDAEQDKWKSKEDSFHYYTNYRDKKTTGPTGRYMHHYLLIAELMSITEAVKNLDSSGTYSTLINKKEEFIRGAITRFKQRKRIKSRDEIEKLRPHVNEMMNALDIITRSAKQPEKSMINKYHWCQLWWAAKEDAQRQWKINDVTGQRKKWH